MSIGSLDDAIQARNFVRQLAILKTADFAADKYSKEQNIEKPPADDIYFQMYEM